jgi:hypothetical protein
MHIVTLALVAALCATAARTLPQAELRELRRQIDSLESLLAQPYLPDCPMPVLPLDGGARRLRFPLERSGSRPVPIPTVPPGCVNPLFPRR